MNHEDTGKAVVAIIARAAKPFRGPRRAEKRSVVCTECGLFRKVGRYGAPEGEDELPAGAIHHAETHQTFASVEAYRRVANRSNFELLDPIESGLVQDRDTGIWAVPE